MSRMSLSPFVIAAVAVVAGTSMASADGEVNLYSSRHYDTDERLYSDFTEATVIKVNRIEGKGDELMHPALHAPKQQASFKASTAMFWKPAFQQTCKTATTSGLVSPSADAFSFMTKPT